MTVQLSPTFCSHNGVVILSSDKLCTRIGLLNPEDKVLQSRIIKSFPEEGIEFESIDEKTFNLKLSRFYSFTSEQQEGTNATEDSRDKGSSDINLLAEDAPLINLLNSIFLEAIARRASDIHIESEQIFARIRFRIDGKLINILKVEIERAQALSARLKLLANLNVLESRKPQDGRLDITSGKDALDIRISITPTIYGESVVLRLLNRKDIPLSLKDLGFSDVHLALIIKTLSIASGLVLITGPTGSGKTTTLSAMLRIKNDESLKIISIEDPVENRIEGISQIQTNDELGLTFDMLLRRVFRQDPDVIMIGEIRDAVTAELAIRAALTGHLVFATLHTNSAVEAITRLQDMGVASYLLAATLKAIIGQRLVRKYCASCHGDGCPECLNTGFRGRTVFAEILPVTMEIAEGIRTNAGIAFLKKELKKSDFKTIADDAKDKVLSRITSDAEVASELGVDF